MLIIERSACSSVTFPAVLLNSRKTNCWKLFLFIFTSLFSVCRERPKARRSTAWLLLLLPSVCLYSDTMCVTWGPDPVMNTKHLLTPDVHQHPGSGVRGQRSTQLHLTPISFRKWRETWYTAELHQKIPAGFSWLFMLQDIKINKYSKWFNERSWSGS